MYPLIAADYEVIEAQRSSLRACRAPDIQGLVIKVSCLFLGYKGNGSQEPRSWQRSGDTGTQEQDLDL